MTQRKPPVPVAYLFRGLALTRSVGPAKRDQVHLAEHVWSILQTHGYSRATASNLRKVFGQFESVSPLYTQSYLSSGDGA